MPLTEADKQRIQGALDKAWVDTRDADEGERGRAMQVAFLASAGDLPTSDTVAFLREYQAGMRQEQLRASRAINTMDTLFAVVQERGLETPGQLMAQMGLTTLPQLLGALGFTGDLDALAAELEAAIRAGWRA